MSRSAYDLETPRHVDWRDSAACRDYDPTLWDLVGQALTSDNMLAKRICHRCPVLAECDSWAQGRPFDGVIVAGQVRRQFASLTSWGVL